MYLLHNKICIEISHNFIFARQKKQKQMLQVSGNNFLKYLFKKFSCTINYKITTKY